MILLLPSSRKKLARLRPRLSVASQLVTQGNPLPWLNDLSSFQIKMLLEDPDAYLAAGVVENLLEQAPIYAANFVSTFDASGQKHWMLEPHVAQDLKDQRNELDTWWADVPDDARTGILGYRTKAGMIAGKYRETVEALPVVGALESGDLGLFAPFALPKLIRGYLELVEPRARAVPHTNAVSNPPKD